MKFLFLLTVMLSTQAYSSTDYVYDSQNVIMDMVDKGAISDHEGEEAFIHVLSLKNYKIDKDCLGYGFTSINPECVYESHEKNLRVVGSFIAGHVAGKVLDEVTERAERLHEAD